MRSKKDKRKFTETVRDELKFLDYAPVDVPVSRKGHRGSADPAADPRLLRIGLQARDYRRAESIRRDLEDRAADQDLLHYSGVGPAPDVRPLHRQAGALHFSAERFIINRLRERFGFKGTPVVLKVKTKTPAVRRGR